MVLGTIDDQVLIRSVGALSPASVGEDSKIRPNEVPIIQFQKLNTTRLQFHDRPSISPFGNASDPAKRNGPGRSQSRIYSDRTVGLRSRVD